MIGGQTCMQKIEHKAVVVVIMATAFLFTFSQFLLITAYPTIMDEFGVNATQVQCPILSRIHIKQKRLSSFRSVV